MMFGLILIIGLGVGFCFGVGFVLLLVIVVVVCCCFGGLVCLLVVFYVCVWFGFFGGCLWVVVFVRFIVMGITRLFGLFVWVWVWVGFVGGG